MDPVQQIIQNLRKWRALPGYSVERRLDILLTPYLPTFLTEELGGPVELVTAEFPLSKRLFEGPDATRQHISVDFLCIRRGDNPAWILVELKTDVASKRAKQEDAYRVVCATRTMSEVLKLLRETKTGREYEALLESVTKVGRRVEKIEVCYIEPIVGSAGVGAPKREEDPSTRAVTWRLGLGKLARHISPEGDPFGRMLQQVLRGIARSKKARRTRI